MKLRVDLTQLILALSDRGPQGASAHVIDGLVVELRQARRRLHSIMLYFDSPSEGNRDAT
jgi:hypothetical protein